MLLSHCVAFALNIAVVILTFTTNQNSLFLAAMSPSSSNRGARQPRILLFPSAGMGHLVPFARLATALSARGIDITLLAARPTVSAAESRLLSSLPSSILQDFPLPPLDPSLFPPFTDPFFLRTESIRRSVPLLAPMLSSFSALVVDIFAASTFLPVASAMSIPCFILSTSSAAMLALITVFRSYGDVGIADICKIPSRSLPPPLRDPNHLFTRMFVDNGRAITLSDGILMNTFEALEPEMVAAFHSGKVEHGFPPAFDIGPPPPVGATFFVVPDSAVARRATGAIGHVR
ncbi:hypothetical protein HPP92_026691 [Vanilla planifolia]|uniref:Uncharacterized protein n=1 Tax=Vanilla planifolia TaxID=51239 RepID=A0A835PFU7_VANPL|nr:hypothetical protein HPP92_026691 [Vanilla planifolia]